MKTAAERSEAMRQQRAADGLKRLEVYAPPDTHASIKAYAARATKTSQKRRKAP